METTNNKTHIDHSIYPIGADFFERLWEESWTYIKTVVDVVREPVLILDSDLKVMVANEAFYSLFKVEIKDTENKNVYELGNGQWNIPALRELIEDILPENTFFKGFEVTHDFPEIGKRVMILNGRRIFREDKGSKQCPPIILLAMEDVTEMMGVAEMLALHTNQFEIKMNERTEKLGQHIKALEREISELKKEF